ncbi:MAG: hypothetical protein ABEJ76_00940 [Halanaeroarchaeum sp.]
MDGLLSPAVVELLELLVSLVGFVAFTVGGALADVAGLQDVLAGQPALGVWELWMGTVALFAGLYLVGYRALVPRVLGRGPTA